MYGKDFLDNMKSTSSKSVNSVISEKTKGMGMGMLIGGGIGLAVAYQRKSPLLVGILIGGLLGGVVSSFFIKKPNKEVVIYN